MAKRDPYHQSNARFVWCRCCRNDSDDARVQIRRARHAGKREAHAAVIDAAEISFDRWYDEHCQNEYEYAELGDPWEAWPTFEIVEPVAPPEPLATLADVA